MAKSCCRNRREALLFGTKSAHNCAFYQPKANYKQWRNFSVWRAGIVPAKLPRNFIQSEVSIQVTCNNLIFYKTGFKVDVKRATPLFNSFGSNSKGKKVSANRVLITWLICSILTFYPCVRVVYICWCVPTWCAETSYITRTILLQIAKRMPLFSVRRSEIWARDQMLIEKEALCCLLLIKNVSRLSPQPHPRPPNAYLLPKNNV